MQKNIKLNKEGYMFILLCTLSFFISRIDILYMLNPIIISFLACLLFRSKLFSLGIIFSLLGFLSKSFDFYIIKYIICLFVMFISNIIFFNNNLKNNIVIKAIFSSIAIFISSIIVSIIDGFSLYYLTISIVEAFFTFCMCFILNRGVSYILKGGFLKTEDIISLSIIVGSVIYGSSDVFIGSMSFTYFFIISLLLFVCFIYGSSICAMVCILATFLLTIPNAIPSDMIVIFCVSSILSGIFRERGKMAVSLCFSLCILILIFILNINLIDNTLIYSLLGANLLFLAVPCKIYSVQMFANKNTEPLATYTEKMHILASNKLDIYANSFNKLSKTFYSLSDKKTNLDQQDISNLIDEVASKVCSRCSIRAFCWEKNFYSTYQNIFSILNSYEKLGTFSNEAISKEFIENCSNINQFIDVLNKTFEIYKLNLLWKNKVIESRELVGQQLTSISSIISGISKNLCKDVSFNENNEQFIKNALEENGIPTKSVIITENERSKTEVFLKIMPCYVPNKCSKTVVPIVNKVLGKNMCRSNYECIIAKENGESICSLSLIEEQKYRISTSVLSSPKKDYTVSGDSHCFLPVQNGGYLLALSDGMGSGEYAKSQSSATIELLEDFIQAGFSKTLAINMINSVLFLKSSRESFATLDMCSIDLYTGVCEFIKIGAVSTFIVQNGNVSIINSSSLPVGILSNVEPEIRKIRLSSNDIIVMVTDGVIDSASNVLNKEQFICDILSKNISKNTNDIAREIYEKTMENYNDNIKDDVSILVARIWSGS